MRKVLIIFLIILNFISCSFASGYKELSFDGLKIGVWYPSDSKTRKTRLGPFEIDIAKNAPLKEGKYDIVIFSHGNGGKFRNHYLTLQKLSKNNYIVLSPQHSADYLIGSDDTAAAMNYRYLELTKALEALKSDTSFSSGLTNKIHGLGYSLGGATMLLAAGAGYSSAVTSKYCDRNAEKDAEFCDDPSFIQRFLKSFGKKIDLPKTSGKFRNKPIVNGKLILVAPVSKGVLVDSIGDLELMTVFGIEGDKIAKPDVHAFPLTKSKSLHVKGEYKLIIGHHFAFISPFPKWLTDKEDIPIAKDPKGFDRANFIDKINNEIVSILNSDVKRLPNKEFKEASNSSEN